MDGWKWRDDNALSCVFCREERTPAERDKERESFLLLLLDEDEETPLTPLLFVVVLCCCVLPFRYRVISAL